MGEAEVVSWAGVDGCMQIHACCVFLSSQMHIVSLKKGVAQPTADPEGIAVLGFFIDVSCSTVITPHVVSVPQNSKPHHEAYNT